MIDESCNSYWLIHGRRNLRRDDNASVAHAIKISIETLFVGGTSTESGEEVARMLSSTSVATSSREIEQPERLINILRDTDTM
jgi:hypothetical protein